MSQKTGAPALTGKLPQNLIPISPIWAKGISLPAPEGFLQTFDKAAIRWIREEYGCHSKLWHKLRLRYRAWAMSGRIQIHSTHVPAKQTVDMANVLVPSLT